MFTRSEEDYSFGEKRSLFDDQKYIRCQFEFISGRFERASSGNFDCLQRVLDAIKRTIDQSGDAPRRALRPNSMHIAIS